jgi:2-oxoglutarate dehydrogenase E1 component
MGPSPWYTLNVWPQLDHAVHTITRPSSSSPSVGTAKRHAEEQKSLIAAAFESESGRTVENY